MQRKLYCGLRSAFAGDFPYSCSCHFKILLRCVDRSVHCKGAEIGGEDLTEGFRVISVEPY